MSAIPDDLRYSQDHLWVRRDSGSSLVRVGVTDFAQDSMGDVIDVTRPLPGDAVEAGQTCGTIESAKSISDLIAPVTGTVRAGNDHLSGNPSLVNSDPYGEGWIFEVETDPTTPSTSGPDGRRRLPRPGRCLMDYEIQVVTVPVRDVDQALEFYTQQAGFVLDVDYHPISGFRVVQLTPRGSACSVQIGTGLTDATPGSVRASYLAVTDIEAACRELRERGVRVGGIRHKSPVEDWKGGWESGADPERRDYASFADFADPDGNTWILQEIGYRTPGKTVKAGRER
jgi:glycine cleavage system H protein